MVPDLALLHKYNVAVPRYTSYPTVPFWKEGIDKTQWKTSFIKAFEQSNKQTGISLYLHLPFCESLCTYCGCTKKITNNHSVEDEYMQAIIKEWNLYVSLMPHKPIIRELHIGGGTPTFFSPENLGLLLDEIFKGAEIAADHAFSIEGHPNNTTEAHLQVLYNKGFRRISYGVQDNNEKVQAIINRIQPFDNLVQATETARAIGFTSVNFDLIYGLPLQTEKTIVQTITECITLNPDRVAFYSYAHVPWTSRGQRLFDENDLPSVEEKMALYVTGKKAFSLLGYEDIGMDHFALPHDELVTAKHSQKLHRNFMGYTTTNTNILIGLGMSAISDIGTAFAQNNKTLHEYYEIINSGELPINKGYFLTDEDVAFRKYILDISCTGHTVFAEKDLSVLREYSFPKLHLLTSDGLINWNETGLSLTNKGTHFIRNICSAFDLYLQRQKKEIGHKNMYSKAI